MNIHTDIVVVGGGIIGLSAALALHRRGKKVVIIDNSSLSPTFNLQNTRVYALNQRSIDFLQQLYIDIIPLCAYQKMLIWDSKSGDNLLFDSRITARAHLGYIVDEYSIKQQLLLAIEKDKIPCYPHVQLKSIKNNNNGVTLNDGTNTWSTNLLIGADGKNSFVREQLKVGVTYWPYHQTAITATISTTLPHNNTAYQIFLRDGPLAFLPLEDEHHCSIVWSLPTIQAQTLMQQPDDVFAQSLTTEFASKLGKCTLITKRTSFPLEMRHVRQYSGNNWLLMGDAAHTIHPLAGLGLNIGFADVIAWLRTAPATTTPRELAAYQRERKYALWQTIMLIQALKAWFTHPLTVAFRGLSLKACNRLEIVKRWLINSANNSL